MNNGIALDVLPVGEWLKHSRRDSTNLHYRIRLADMIRQAMAAMGGAPPNPGKIRALRKNIARILTIMREEELAGGTAAPAKAAPAKAAPSGEET